MPRECEASNASIHARGLIACLALAAIAAVAAAIPISANGAVSTNQDGVVELTFESKRTYADPFNDIEIDVIFNRENRSWRVPAFWRGGLRWSVRFAPHSAGTYKYLVETTDPSNSELNAQEGRVVVRNSPRDGSLLQRGPLKLSQNKRYFEHADGTPFYWLGDTWWNGLSDRLSWEGFQRLTADRKDKGFTVVQIVAGLVPIEEPLSEAGFCNEGGCVWEIDFSRINPRYFDFADRRVQHLVENGIVPLIVGGWRTVLPRMGVEKMKKHWRYIVARYGAYPVLWSVGGEMLDPPKQIADQLPEPPRSSWVVQGWTDVAKYVGAVDPYHHPMTAHELPPPLDVPLQNPSLTDFDLLQSSQFGWASIAFSVAQLNSRHARTGITRPIVQGEIGYENHFSKHFEEFQRAAFWLSMLNGAAGHTYGAEATWGAYSSDRTLPRVLLSFLNWEEGMKLPGSYQVGLGSKLLRQYQWWRFEPHPEWVTPRGKSFFDSDAEFELDGWTSWWVEEEFDEGFSDSEMKYPSAGGADSYAGFDRPYAAGIPGQVRIIYIPVRRDSPMPKALPPTVLGLEAGVCYNAYLWEPGQGIRIELGAVERPFNGDIIFEDRFLDPGGKGWVNHARGQQVPNREMPESDRDVLSVVKGIKESSLTAEVEVKRDTTVGVVVRHDNSDSYVAAIYSAEEKAIYLRERRNGIDNRHLGKTSVPRIGRKVRLSIEVRGSVGAASLHDGERSYTTPIIQLQNTSSGTAGLLHGGGLPDRNLIFENFTLRRSPGLREDGAVPPRLYDARGVFRGDSPNWGTRGKHGFILLDAYRPEKLPSPGDWILVLDATQAAYAGCAGPLVSSNQ